MAALLAHPLPAEAQPAPAGTMRYRVRPGDTCVRIAQRFFGDPDAYDQVHLYNPGLGPTPHHLAPGTTLLLPERAAAEVPARLSALRPRVEHRPPSAQRFAPARRGEALRRGSHLRTLEGASAELTFADRSRVQVREQTLVIVYGGARRFGRRDLSRAELERGTLRSHLDELAGLRPLRVDTPGSQATLPGAAVVSVGEDGSSQIANHGEAPATIDTSGGGRLSLPGGTGTVVRAGQPSPPRPLLAAPRWVVDPGGPVLAFAGLGATVEGSWEPVPGARAYRVEISRQPGGGELVEALSLPGEAPRFTARGLLPGTYYVRVASIDAAGLEGRRSPRRVFRVEAARLIQPGGAPIRGPEPGAEEGVAEGEEAPLPRVLPGTWVVAPVGFECGEGSERSAIYTLREVGRREIACVRTAGAQILTAALEVEAVVPALEAEAGLVRERRNELRVLLRGGRPPPVHALLVEGPEALRVARPRLLGERTLLLAITPRIDAPDLASLRVSILAGTERILLGALELPVRDPAPEEPRSAPEAPAAPAPPEPPPALSSLWGRLALPAAIGLRDAFAPGISAWAHLGLLDAGPAPDPQLRVGVGVRARLPQTPLSLGFATQLDALQPPLPLERRGDADLLAGADLALYEEALLQLGLSLWAWLPTRASAGLTRARLVPSAEVSLRPLPWLALRTRQGALVDAVEDGAILWAFALGADLFPLSWLGVSVELDGSVGRFADGAPREDAALALGAAFTGRWAWLEASLGARAALTEASAARLGAWTLALSLSVRSE